MYIPKKKRLPQKKSNQHLTGFTDIFETTDNNKTGETEREREREYEKIKKDVNRSRVTDKSMECVQSVSTWLKGSVQSSIHHVGNLCGQSLVVTEQNRSPKKRWTNKDSLPLRPIETFDIKNKWPRLLFASSFNNLHVCQDCVIGLSEQNLRIYRKQEFLYSFFIYN